MQCSWEERQSWERLANIFHSHSILKASRLISDPLLSWLPPIIAGYSMSSLFGASSAIILPFVICVVIILRTTWNKCHIWLLSLTTMCVCVRILLMIHESFNYVFHESINWMNKIIIFVPLLKELQIGSAVNCTKGSLHEHPRALKVIKWSKMTTKVTLNKILMSKSLTIGHGPTTTNKNVCYSLCAKVLNRNSCHYNKQCASYVLFIHYI